MSKTRCWWREDKNVKGSMLQWCALIGTRKSRRLLSFYWPPCALDGQFLSPTRCEVYIRWKAIVLLMLFFFVLFVVLRQCSFASKRRETSHGSYPCNYVIIPISIHIRTSVCMWMWVKRERESEERKVKACYFNHHDEQMFYGLLIIILVNTHIPDGANAKKFVKE